MAFNVNEFSGALKGGGARASLFQVQITNPINGVADAQVPFMVKAAQIPASTVGTIEVPYFGRQIKIAGNRTYAEWAPTIINDEDFAIRNAMEQWSNTINSAQGNLNTAGGSAPSLYKSNAQVTQFAKDGSILRVYNFVGIYPTEVAAIDLAWPPLLRKRRASSSSTSTTLRTCAMPPTSTSVQLRAQALSRSAQVTTTRPAATISIAAAAGRVALCLSSSSGPNAPPAAAGQPAR